MLNRMHLGGPDEDTMEEVAEVNRDLEQSRDEARTAAAPAIRGVEKALRDALGGEPLRGMRNIGAGQGAPLYAARIRGKPDGKLTWPQKSNTSTESLIIAIDGTIMMARCRTAKNGIIPDVDLRPAIDGDFRAEDLDNYLRTVAEIVPRHIVQTNTARERYTKLRELSDRVLRALTGEGDRE